MATRHPASTNPNEGALIVLIVLAMVAVPAAITLHTVHDPVTLAATSTNPTPYGYTWSLLMFLTPIVVILGWLLPQEGVKIPKRAFWRTIAVLVPFGFALDFFFANRFFIFPNEGATLKIGAPAIGGPVPIEEYIFYLTGFIAVLAIYVWLDEHWLAAYNVPDYKDAASRMKRLLTFHPMSLGLGVVLVVLGILYKKGFSAHPEGFPGYFIVLVSIGFVPALGLYPAARSVINWRALGFTLSLILLISLFWEVTLAIPYGWWDYQPERMLGMPIRTWANLPIEAVGVWIAVTYATVIVYEVTKLWQASERSAKSAFFGTAD